MIERQKNRHLKKQHSHQTQNKASGLSLLDSVSYGMSNNNKLMN